MAVKVIKGNIFTSQCQTLVNTVNCDGFMGAGIALEFRLRYPEMYQRYVKLCEQKMLDVGLLWLYKANDKFILNFPTKKAWKLPAKEKYLHLGLEKFVETYRDKGVSSAAFPLLGAGKGGIDQEISLKIMQDHLKSLDIPIEIYCYDPNAEDDLFTNLKSWLLSNDIVMIKKITKINEKYIELILEALKDSSIKQVGQLGKVKGIGIKTLEKLFSAGISFEDNIQTLSDSKKQNLLEI